jgi:hypothetical protein
MLQFSAFSQWAIIRLVSTATNPVIPGDCRFFVFSNENVEKSSVATRMHRSVHLRAIKGLGFEIEKIMGDNQGDLLAFR